MIIPTQQTQTQDYIALEDRYNAHNYKPLDVVLERGEGVWVWDVDGHQYMDFLSAYSAVNQGHAHPRIVAALTQQAQRLPLTSRAFRNDQLPLLARELCELTGYEKMLPMNSGAEAVETALKVARKWGLRGQRRARQPGRDYRLQRQLPRTHHYHHQLLRRPAEPARLRPTNARLQNGSFRGRGCAHGGRHAEHRRRPI